TFYDANSFPEDLVLMETGDRTNFQGRYVLHYPWQGGSRCVAGDQYLDSLPARFRHEAENLAGLTAWSQSEIWIRMEPAGQSSQRGRSQHDGRCRLLDARFHETAHGTVMAVEWLPQRKECNLKAENDSLPLEITITDIYCGLLSWLQNMLKPKPVLAQSS